MTEFKNGIYRTLTFKEDNKNVLQNAMSDEIFNFIKIWQSSCGQYTNYNSKEGHALIGSGLDTYIHITSPIRRLVDLLNIMKLQDLLDLNSMSIQATDFYNHWFNRLDYINITMRSIRQAQMTCNTLSMCVNTPNILDEIYDGYLFDKIERENNYLQYTVYIPKIKIVSQVNLKLDLKDYSSHKFKLYLIENGITLKRKIRAEIQ